MVFSIAHVVFPVPVDTCFDYIIPEHLLGKVCVGARVQAVFARKKSVGVVVGLADRSEYKELNTLIKVLDPAPLFSPLMLDFARSFAQKNVCSTGEAIFLALPSCLRKSKKSENQENSEKTSTLPGSVEVSLIFDRGLAGRWDVLLPRMRRVLEGGKGVLVLLPESSYLEDVLPRLADLADPGKRGLLRQGTEGEEYERWMKILRGEARLVVGFLSAVFAPVSNLGLIVIVDEESRFYKNDQSPFYHAREAAFARAEKEGSAVVCVSSAPSVELWHDVAAGKLPVERIDAALPPVRFLDITNFKMKKGSLLSPGLRLHLERALKDGGKALLYVPAAKGVGFVLEEIRKYMPQARAAGYERLSSAMPDVDILVATQAIFRYRGRAVFDFAAALDIDYEFHKDDHRAAHGAFALVQYLRQMAHKSVLLQTRESKSPQLHAIAEDRCEKFYADELLARKEMGFPPFGAFAALVVRSSDPELACAEAKRLYDVLSSMSTAEVNVMEPQQDRTAVVRGKFRWRVMLQGNVRSEVVGMAREAALKFRGKKDTILTVNIDP